MCSLFNSLFCFSLCNERREGFKNKIPLNPPLQRGKLRAGMGQEELKFHTSTAAGQWDV